jgi:drug/metabolite transporter (DMT)-like permease
MPVISKQNYCWVLILALIQTTTQYVFSYIGVSNTTGASATIFSSISACYAVVLAHFFYTNDKLNTQKVVGSVVCVFGIFVSTLGEGTISFSLNGEGMLLVSQFCFALGSVFNKRITKVDDPIVVTSYSMTIGGIILIFIGFVSGGRLPTVTLPGLLVLGYLALLSALAFTLWGQVLKFHPLGKISVFTFIVPIVGTLSSALVLGEDILHIKYPISLLLVTVGIYAIHMQRGRDKDSVVLPR